jgi:succinate-semialdehyde dehydrogenase/glutarate-semialdehyde dehydrogenase
MTPFAYAKVLRPRNPRTGAAGEPIACATSDDLIAISHRLRAAQVDWRAHSLSQRAERLRILHDAIARHANAIAAAVEVDTGRRTIARREVDGVLASILGWAGQVPSLLDTSWTQGRSAPHLRHRPEFHAYPLVGVISPWNFPLTLSMIDTIPALLAGCTVIVKPSEVTPRFVAPLQIAIIEAGFGDLLHFIYGEGDLGAALTQHVDAICFTGSVATGRKVALACAHRLIPAFLELGGKDPLIILEGCDLDAACTAALRGSVLASGQACQSIERIYVQQTLHDRFVANLTHAAQSCRFNWPDINFGAIGPIIFDRQAEIYDRQIGDAVARGATVHCGGVIEHHGGGLWLAPTVLSGVTHDMLVMQEETFGPIMPVMAFDALDHAVHLANDTPFGLSAAVFAADLSTAEAVAVRLQAGAVSLNDAALTALFYEAEKHSFGESGLGGSRMGAAGFSRFLRRQALIANTAAPAPLSEFAERA